MSGASVTSLFMGVAFLAATITAGVMVPQIIEDEIGPPEGPAVADVWSVFIWTVGLLFTAGYVAAGIGLGLEQPWGKAMAWMMMPWTVLVVLPGLPIAIYQMVALPKHA